MQRKWKQKKNQNEEVEDVFKTKSKETITSKTEKKALEIKNNIEPAKLQSEEEVFTKKRQITKQATSNKPDKTESSIRETSSSDLADSSELKKSTESENEEDEDNEENEDEEKDEEESSEIEEAKVKMNYKFNLLSNDPEALRIIAKNEEKNLKRKFLEQQEEEKPKKTKEQSIRINRYK